VITEAADIGEGTTLDADLCIIGGGAAGITIARELAGTNLKVVLLESGGTAADAETTSLYEGQYLADPFINVLIVQPIPLDAVRLRYLGGTTGHWAGYCRPVDPIAFEDRPWIPASGWPISREQLDPFYERAAEVILLPSASGELGAWEEQDLGPPLLDDGVIDTRIIQINFPMLFGSVYRPDLEAADNVQVVLHANVTRVGASQPNADHIEQVDVQTLDGRSFNVRSRAYVVASGGIESARLLLASNDVNPAGVGNENDLVGRNFCEHLVLPGGFALLTPSAEDLRLYEQAVVPGPDESREILARGALVLSGDAQREGQLLDWEAQIVPGTYAAGSPGQPQGVRAADVDPLVQQVDGAAPASITYVQVTGEQIPRPENQVVLSDALDALGQRRADLRWTVAPEERASLVSGLDLLGRQLAAAGLGRLQYVPGGIGYNPDPPEDAEQTAVFLIDPAAEDPESFPVGVGFHHMGTLRMATDPAQGVVDADAKVHTVDNLWVAGSSVFPVTGANTPTMTIVALALRLADHLRTQVLT
jgi:choline dehydrogenase-like flavoprotein